MTFHRMRPSRSWYSHLSGQQLSRIDRELRGLIIVDSLPEVRKVARRYGVPAKDLVRALSRWRYERRRRREDADSAGPRVFAGYAPSGAGYSEAYDLAGNKVKVGW